MQSALKTKSAGVRWLEAYFATPEGRAAIERHREIVRRCRKPVRCRTNGLTFSGGRP